MEIVWVVWIVLFLILEGIALADARRGDTLSENVWQWFCIRGEGRWCKLRRLVLVLFLAWLVIHFLTGGWV